MMTQSMVANGAGFRAGAVAAGFVMIVGLVAAGPVGPAEASPLGATVTGSAAGASGTVTAWGWNELGQTTVPADLGDVTAVAAGAWHSLALKADGTVTAWGNNRDGQTAVPAGLADVTAIAASAWHSMALKADGTVTAWGDNGSGQTTVPAGLIDVTAISTAYYHSLALKADGTVTAWGDNGFGQTQVPAGLADVTAIAAGFYHSLALKADGTVTAWGDNPFGETQAPAGLTDVTAIAAGPSHSLALRADGTVTAWGDNGFGQATVPAGLTDVVAIAAGANHSLALKADGTVTAWGRNLEGQTAVPVDLIDVTAIAAGSHHSLAIVAGATDVTAPIATPTQLPDANGAGWNSTDVTVDWNWTEEAGASGIDSDHCTTASTSTGDGELTLQATCQDLAGNIGEASYDVKVDTTPPALAPSLSPTLGGTLVAYGASVTAAPTASDDGGSGVAESSCQPVDTSTAGAQTLTCSATDIAGNTIEAPVDYVVGFNVTKLSPPTKSKVKAGSGISVKFTLTGAGGQPIPPTLAAQLSSACGATVTLAGQAPVCATYDPAKVTFTATVKSPRTLTVGSVVSLTTTVKLGIVTIATGSTSITITK